MCDIIVKVLINFNKYEIITSKIAHISFKLTAISISKLECKFIVLAIVNQTPILDEI
jgi:hypothetical protein